MGSKEWYVLYTREGNEKKLSATLSKKGFPVLVPLTSGNGLFKAAARQVAVFKSFVFVCCNDSDLLALRKIPGVINFIYWLNKPVKVPQQELDQLMMFLERCHDVCIDQGSPVPEGSIEMEEKEIFEMPSMLMKLKGSPRLRVIYDHPGVPAVVA